MAPHGSSQAFPLKKSGHPLRILLSSSRLPFTPALVATHAHTARTPPPRGLGTAHHASHPSSGHLVFFAIAPRLSFPPCHSDPRFPDISFFFAYMRGSIAYLWTIPTFTFRSPFRKRWQYDMPPKGKGSWDLELVGRLRDYRS